MGAMTASYTPSTDLLESTTLGAVETTYSYSGFGDLSGMLYEASNVPFYGVSYTRDALGRVATKTETRPSGSTLRCYVYDSSDRLEAVYDGADSSGCIGTQLEAYTYDLNGNRTSVTNSAGTVGLGSIVTDDQDRLLQHGDFTYTYNEAGQMTSRTETSTGDVWSYVYDAVGNLREVDPPGMGGTITYITDPRNRRVGKRVDGLLVQGFLYGDQLNPIAELDGSGDVVSRFVYGTNRQVPEYMVRSGSVYRLVTDEIGSVVAVYDVSSGQLVQEREYDSFGRMSPSSWTQPGFSQPFGFAGGHLDSDTDLVRFGARDYDPEIGRWMEKDPSRFGGGLNMFAYVGGDPLNYVDPAGKARVHPGLSSAFPKSANAIRRRLAALGKRRMRKRRRTLAKTAGLEWYQWNMVRKALKDGQGPIVSYQPLEPGEASECDYANGSFVEGFPNAVFVDPHVLRAFETGNISEDELLSTVEHELVHLFDYRVDGEQQFVADNGRDIGDLYEKLTYGKYLLDYCMEPAE